MVKKTSLALIALCALLAAVPQPGRAAEIDRPIPAWPLVYHSGDKDRSETDVLWPVFRYVREKTFTRFAIRPFIFSTERDPAKEYRKTSVVWPLIIHRREAAETTLHIFPVYWYKSAPESRYNVVFPVFWDGAGKNYSYFHLWPLFGVNRDDSRVEYSTLYPFFRSARDSTSGEVDIHAPWPLARYHRQGDAHSHYVFPLYWFDRSPSHARGFVFPYFWSDSGSRSARGIFPLWYSSRSGDERTDLVIPLYYNRETADTRLRFITPLYFSSQSPETRTRMLFPLYFGVDSPQQRFRIITPLFLSQRTGESSYRTLLPVHFAYSHQDVSLSVTLPVYFRYRSGPYTLASFFPVYFHSGNTEQRTDFTYYFPVYGSYQRGASVSRHFLFFPLYSQLRDDETGLRAWDVLWPLFHYESSPTTRAARLLPLYWHSQEPERSSTVLFPFYWSVRSGENSYRHLVPLYGVHREGDSYVKRFIIGPLFMDTRDAKTGLSQQDALFFLYSGRVQGDERRSWLFPFYCHQSDRDSSFTLGSLALLPPYLVRSEEPGKKLFHLWPFYGLREKGVSRERSFLWPLVRFANDPAKDSSMTHVLLYYHEREGRKSFSTLFPLWFHRSSPEAAFDASLFLHWYDRDEKKDATSLSLLWIIPPDLSLIRYYRAPGVVRHGVFPLYSYFHDEKRDALSWSLFWFLFSYESEGEFAQQTDFLWNVITYEQKDEETYDFRFLWRFIRKSRTATSSTFEFNPFYYYEQEEGKGSYWAILGGLIGVETSEDQRKKLRLFWIF